MHDPRFVPPPVQPAFQTFPTEGPGATKSDATTVFILGLLGIILCQVLAPFAWVKGNTYVRCCAIAEVPPDGLGVAGRIMGIIGTVLLVLTLLWILFVFGMMVLSG
ncbi:MAG: DUF4190 domain-containing protein [Myxococcales bacterium]|nr:DUF4190 domain-containing protein [Myxococcales bacterium]